MRRYDRVDELLATENVNYGTGTAVSEGVLWTLADHQNTIRDIYGKSDQDNDPATPDTYGVIEHRQYDSFGRPTNLDLSKPLIVRQGYTGREFEIETGLQYSRSRYYDPATRSFIQEDNIGFAGGQSNLYQYVGNSPANATDPSGNIVCGGVCVAAATFGVYALWRAGFAATETAVEYGATSYLGTQQDIDQFSAGGTFLKNFVINLATGGIGGKIKTGSKLLYYTSKVGLYGLRQGIEVGGDTAYDVYANGRDFESALATNAIGSVLGEAGGAVIGAGLRRGTRAFNDNFQISFDPATLSIERLRRDQYFSKEWFAENTWAHRTAGSTGIQ